MLLGTADNSSNRLESTIVTNAQRPLSKPVESHGEENGGSC